MRFSGGTNFRRLKERLAQRESWEKESSVISLPHDGRLFNEAIGLPVSPKTNLPHALTQYQLDLFSYQGKDLIVNKSNKIGITEIFLRDMAYRGAVGDCRTYDLLLGSSEELLAMENMRRLQALFQNSDILRPLIREAIATRMVLRDGTRYLVMPSNPQALRSWPRVKYEFLDEAAHLGRLDDSEYIAAATSRLSNTNGYLRVVSTPRGMRGFFWQLATKAQRGEIQMAYFELNYYVGIGTFFEQEYIDKEKGRLGPLFEQEYMCKFISSQTAAIESDLLDRAQSSYKVQTW